MKLLLTVFLGGATGSMLRYGTGVWLLKSAPDNFPYATLLVNIAGSLLIGIFYALSIRYQWFSQDLRLLLITGFCGGFTTFSAFAFENFKLVQEGQYLTFLLYSLASFTLTLLAVFAGSFCIKILG